MAELRPQTYANHARYVPLYHFVIAGILVIYLGGAVWRLLRSFSFDAVLGVLLALALLGMFYYLRAFPLTVQDRLIRLEMRLRLQGVLPEDLAARIEELTPGQLVALRFASDGELPGLVREVLEQGLTDRTAIKKNIQHWQPDHLRC